MTPSIFAPIKVNLALHVGPPRADGYHPVDTLCVFPMIGDVVSFDPEGEAGIDLSGPFGHALAGQGMTGNLVFKAFGLLGMLPQGRFLLVKNTPVASGVGAGTADGAAAMLLLNAVYELGFEADELIELAQGLGADGPVCMAGQIHGGGLWRARGIGERVEKVGTIEPQAIVVANPGAAVSTAEVFRRFDAGRPEELMPVTVRRSQRLSDVVRANRNDLAGVAEDLVPAITGLKSLMADQPGARAVRMSGSGATVFALHTSLASAERAATQLRGRGMWAESAPLLAG